MRYTGPKVKKARRLGMAFTNKDAKVLQKRAYPPGQHGQNRIRLSEYGLQLKEKQKAKVNYGIQERQFANYFNKALRQTGQTGENLIKLLETRLDNVVFRLGFAETRMQARQMVNHGFFEVNDKKTNIPSLVLKVGDTVSVRGNKKKSKLISQLPEKLKSFKSQDWLQLDASGLSGKVLSHPSSENTGNTIDTQLIVEHYSRN